VLYPEKYISPNEIIRYNEKANVVFLKYGISTDSKRPLNDICINKDISAEFIIDIIYQFEIYSNKKIECFYNYEINTLIDFLERSHRFYLDTCLPKLGMSLINLLRLCSNNSQLLIFAVKLFNKFAEDLKEHFFFEEKNLFVFSKYLHNAKVYSWDKNRIASFLILYSLNDFIDAHPKTENDLDVIIKVLEEYKPKREEKMIYNVLISQILEFKKDLKIHALIEDKVLIDKLVSLQNCIMNNQ
jgi:regulator of cell morphogenesis and NO signaling